ncbi:hypothetical protein [Chryseobacterium sp. ERMR1:04]|uniref:hypothetical protein n=1 Tax=Chryseobacterium sp. ERMR1:04 TaxID=1705393 RepID=UPI0006C8794A|nr:hypothetical protein [Chryseobacterium sp. ERMR1:04]KPH14698.1 hypothetical protein AMQ68_04405 [Chryseobacterium sp. ERMR1:04]
MEIEEEIKKIEEILGIASEEEDKKSNSITRLKLKDVIIDDFSKFSPYLSKLRTLDLTNCTISCFSELLKLEHCNYFYLDNVTFRNYVNDNDILVSTKPFLIIEKYKY